MMLFRQIILALVLAHPLHAAQFNNATFDTVERNCSYYSGDDEYPLIKFGGSVKDPVPVPFGLKPAPRFPRNLTPKGSIKCLLKEVKPGLKNKHERMIWKKLKKGGQNSVAVNRLKSKFCKKTAPRQVKKACRSFNKKIKGIVAAGKCLNDVLPKAAKGQFGRKAIQSREEQGEVEISMNSILNIGAGESNTCDETDGGGVLRKLRQGAVAEGEIVDASFHEDETRDLQSDPSSRKLDICTQTLVDIIVPVR